MSFHKNDRKFQSKKGKSFPGNPGYNEGRFARAIAVALREEFGAGPSAIKTVARLTEANERAARNWFEGKNGPNGEYLIGLLRHSDAVLKVLLRLAGRHDLVVTASLAALKAQLLDTVRVIEELQQDGPA